MNAQLYADDVTVDSRVKALCYGTGTVIEITDDTAQNYFVKLDSPTIVGSKMWFSRNELTLVSPPFHAPGELERQAFDPKAAWHTHRALCPECGNPNRDLCDIGDDLFFAVYLDRTRPTEKSFGINIADLIDSRDDALARIAELEDAVKARDAWLNAAANTIERYAAKYGAISTLEDAPRGTCPFCHRPSHAPLCAPLRAAMAGEVDVEALIESLDAARDALELLIFS